MSEVKHPSHKKSAKVRVNFCVNSSIHTHIDTERGHGGWASCFTIWKKTLRVYFVLFSFVYCTSIFFLSWFFFLLLPLPLTFPETRRLFKKIYSVYVCTVYSISFVSVKLLQSAAAADEGWPLLLMGFLHSLSLLLPNFPIFEHVIVIRRGRVHRTTWICFGPQQQPEQIGRGKERKKQ